MTVQELYKLTKNLMFEKPTSKDYDNYYMDNINVLLSENFDLNNHVREFRGKEPLLICPVVTSKEDELPYEDTVCREVLPYGLAAAFFIDDDLSKFSIFNTKYTNAKITVTKYIPRKIKDVFS